MNDEPVSISVLSRGDAQAMYAVLDLLAAAFEDPCSYSRAQPDAAYIEAQLARDTFIAIAAKRGNQTIGALIAYVLPKIEQRRSEIYLYDLAVAQDFRRMGIATAMIGRLQTLAAERGAFVIFVQADYGDGPAIALYEKLGVREDVMHFDIRVPGQG